MDSILQSIEDWFRGLLVSGIMDNLSNTFESVNNQVGQIATEVGQTPANFSPAVYNMIRTLSENVIMPIAGLILTFIACYELIQLVISHNNLANFETWIFWKWIFKTFVAVTLITNTMNITMAVFDGFVFLVMGYRGKKAASFKEAYIKRFNEMEEFIKYLLEARTEFPLLTENIMLLHESPKPYYFSNEADLLNRIALGKTAKQVREEHGLKPGTSIRPYLTTKQIEAIDRLQRVDIGLLVSTPDFQERKRYLEWYFMKKLQ